MSPDPQRTARFEARIAPDSLELIRRAAEIQGRSISDFVVAAAHEAAVRAIADIEVIRLSVDETEKFVSLLLNPLEPNETLKRAFKRHRERFGE